MRETRGREPGPAQGLARAGPAVAAAGEASARRVSMMSDTGQSRIKHRVSKVLRVMVSPCFMRYRMWEEKPCL